MLLNGTRSVLWPKDEVRWSLLPAEANPAHGRSSKGWRIRAGHLVGRGRSDKAKVPRRGRLFLVGRGSCRAAVPAVPAALGCFPFGCGPRLFRIALRNDRGNAARY